MAIVPQPLFSVIIPAYDEDQSIAPLYRRLTAVMDALSAGYEIIFIDDGSRDDTFQKIEELHRSDGRVRVIRFRRNFGKSAALSAGFAHARGEILITLDADLQDLPEEIPRLLEKLQEGNDMVSSWRFRRSDALTKKVLSKFYNMTVSMLSGVRIRDFNSGLKCYRREVLDEINMITGMHRFIPVLATWKGFTVGQVKVAHDPRRHGRTKYGTGRLLKGFFDLISTMMLIRYSKRPFHIFGLLGLLLTLAGFGICAYMSVQWFMGTWIGDRPLIYLGMLLIIVGLQIGFFGLLCEIVIYSADREPLYSVKTLLDADSD
jgi:glycosyltransferase involved in cell wall biosynthesis